MSNTLNTFPSMLSSRIDVSLRTLCIHGHRRRGLKTPSPRDAAVRRELGGAGHRGEAPRLPRAAETPRPERTPYLELPTGVEVGGPIPPGVRLPGAHARTPSSRQVSRAVDTEVLGDVTFYPLRDGFSHPLSL